MREKIAYLIAALALAFAATGLAQAQDNNTVGDITDSGNDNQWGRR